MLIRMNEGVVNASEVARRHRAAGTAFRTLQSMGARPVDGPMFTGKVHGPWPEGSREFAWTWERQGFRA